MHDEPFPWNDIVDATDSIIGMWSQCKNGWMAVRSPTGATKTARPSLGAQELLARSMLDEPWASA